MDGTLVVIGILALVAVAGVLIRTILTRGIILPGSMSLKAVGIAIVVIGALVLGAWLIWAGQIKWLLPSLLALAIAGSAIWLIWNGKTWEALGVVLVPCLLVGLWYYLANLPTLGNSQIPVSDAQPQCPMFGDYEHRLCMYSDEIEWVATKPHTDPWYPCFNPLPTSGAYKLWYLDEEKKPHVWNPGVTGYISAYGFQAPSKAKRGVIIWQVPGNPDKCKTT